MPDSVLSASVQSPPAARLLARGLLLGGLALAATPANAEVVVEAPGELAALLGRHLQAPDRSADEGALEALAREARRTAEDLLATEGYFAPQLQVRAEPGRLRVSVDPGRQATVSQVDLELRGELTEKRAQALRDGWTLKPGRPFRDADWREAKELLLRRLVTLDFPTAQRLDSRAVVDPVTGAVRLQAIYDSGPRFVFGDLQIRGLRRYSADLVRGYSRIEPGARYDQGALLGLQSALQRTPYFTSVNVDIERPAAPPEVGPVRAPVVVDVSERAPYRLALGAGVSSNTGLQTEASYQNVDFLGRAWQLDAGLRLEQLRQSLYSDVRLPHRGDHRYSFGALADREDIQGQQRRRIAIGAVREQRHGPFEARYAVNWQRELRRLDNGPRRSSTALTVDGEWTLRRVDDIADPRLGYVAQFKAGGGSQALLSDQSFLRLQVRVQQFIPIGRADQLVLRGDLGHTLAPSRQGIPQDFLFRAGGAQSVRGYGYQSLGVREGEAVVGGRYLSVASVEYTRWITARWGAAAFVDAGNAGDASQIMKPAVGYGAGARWRSPAGPLAVDLAYGRRDHRLRLHFSLAVAF